MSDGPCPHGYPSRESCLDCILDEVPTPRLDPQGCPERADGRAVRGRHDQDCPVCHLTLMGRLIVHTTRDRWAHQDCVDPDPASRQSDPRLRTWSLEP